MVERVTSGTSGFQEAVVRSEQHIRVIGASIAYLVRVLAAS